MILASVAGTSFLGGIAASRDVSSLRQLRPELLLTEHRVSALEARVDTVAQDVNIHEGENVVIFKYETCRFDELSAGRTGQGCEWILPSNLRREINDIRHANAVRRGP